MALLEKHASFPCSTDTNDFVDGPRPKSDKNEPTVVPTAGGRDADKIIRCTWACLKSEAAPSGRNTDNVIGEKSFKGHVISPLPLTGTQAG